MLDHDGHRRHRRLGLLSRVTARAQCLVVRSRSYHSTCSTFSDLRLFGDGQIYLGRSAELSGLGVAPLLAALAGYFPRFEAAEVGEMRFKLNSPKY